MENLIIFVYLLCLIAVCVAVVIFVYEMFLSDKDYKDEIEKIRKGKRRG